MAHIEKYALQDGSPRYKAIVRRKDGRRKVIHKTKTFRTRAQAAGWAKRLEVKILDRKALPNWEAEKRTVAELVDRYIEEVLPGKPKSRANQTQQMNWWKEQIGELTLVEVTAPVVVQFRDLLSRGGDNGGPKRQPGTVNRYLAVLSHAFNVASREWEWLETNPVAKVSKLKEPRGRVRFLSDDERTALLKACQKSEEAGLYPLVVLALATGARQGELLRLRWEDVDLGRGVATVHETKNNERRSLPLAGFAVKVMKEFGKIRRLDSDFVFVGGSGKVEFPRRSWLDVLAVANVEDFRFHDLRHSAASYLAMNGATLAEIAEVLGHKTLQMVKRYAHLTDQHTKKVVAEMNEQIFGDLA